MVVETYFSVQLKTKLNKINEESFWRDVGIINRLISIVSNPIKVVVVVIVVVLCSKNVRSKTTFDAPNKPRSFSRSDFSPFCLYTCDICESHERRDMKLVLHVVTEH